MYQKSKSLLVLLIFSSILLSFSYKQNNISALKTIILDAGHGGKDPGAYTWNKASSESKITLAITLKLGKEIEKLIPGIKVYYTRTKNNYPPLHERANFANNKKGDLFVSIHCNYAEPTIKKTENGNRIVNSNVKVNNKNTKVKKSIPKYKIQKILNSANGIETYVWEPSKNDQKTSVIAKKEDAEIFKDKNFKLKYGNGLDIKSPIFIANAKLKTKKYFTRSTLLANLIQDEGEKMGRNDRKVKQRGVGIWVLQATAMPSVLVETGYISNEQEAKYLTSIKGQSEMAKLIAKAIKRYKDELDQGNNNSKNNNSNTKIENNNFLLFKNDEYDV